MPHQDSAPQIAPYQHIVVVMSIVLGLSVTQLLKGNAQIYRARKRVEPSWIHSGWVALLFVFGLLVWWTYWNYRGIAEWDFLRFVVYLSPMIVFYLLTAIVIPDPADTVSTLKEYYFSTGVAFFGIFCAVRGGGWHYHRCRSRSDNTEFLKPVSHRDDPPATDRHAKRQRTSSWRRADSVWHPARGVHRPLPVPACLSPSSEPTQDSLHLVDLSLLARLDVLTELLDLSVAPCKNPS